MKQTKSPLPPLLAALGVVFAIAVGYNLPSGNTSSSSAPDSVGFPSTQQSGTPVGASTPQALPSTDSWNPSQNPPPSNFAMQTPPLRLPAPLTALSPMEARRFPQGVVIDHAISPVPNSKNVQHVRIIDSGTSLGYVRTEEIVDPATNRLLKRNEMRADTLLIKLQDGVDPRSVVASNPSIFKSFTQILPDQPLYEFQLASHNTAALPRGLQFAEELQGDLLVYAEPNGIVTSSKIPNDPEFPLLWGLERIQAPLAWDIRSDTTSFPVIVAVVDTGVDYLHPDLKANMWVNPNETPSNGKDDDQNGYIDDIYGMNGFVGLNKPGNGNPMDFDGHGTHVAGTIAAVGDNSIGVVGVCWNLIKKGTPPATKDSGGIMALKALETSGGTAASIAVCIDYAVKQGAKIINLSLGGPEDSNTLRDAVRAAQTKGIILVAAAGNDGLDIDLQANLRYPACYEFDNIVTVGATDPSDAPAAFSNFGQLNVDIFAPGVGILSTWPTLRASPKDYPYNLLDGTSMATPHVSGALALLLAQYPSEGYRGSISRLYGKADKIPALANLCRTGARVNLNQSIRNITVRPTPPPRTVPNIRNVPNRGTISRDQPAITIPALPGPIATPIPIVDRPTPLPTATPRAIPVSPIVVPAPRVSTTPPPASRTTPVLRPTQTTPPVATPPAQRQSPPRPAPKSR